MADLAGWDRLLMLAKQLINSSNRPAAKLPTPSLILHISVYSRVQAHGTAAESNLRNAEVAAASWCVEHFILNRPTTSSGRLQYILF